MPQDPATPHARAGAEIGRNRAAYLARGLLPIPLKPRLKKPSWKEWQRSDAASLTAYWRNDKLWAEPWPTPPPGVGILTSDVLLGVDVDVKKVDGWATLAELEAKNGALAATWTVLTPTGGAHKYFRAAGLAIGNRVNLWPGLDIRGTGGQLVAPPTAVDEDPEWPHKVVNGVRQDVYRWEVGYSPEKIDLADAPAWLLDALRACEPSEARTPRRTPDEWAAFIATGADRGERNDRIARLTGYLLTSALRPHAIRELVRAWNLAKCRPPLDDVEVVRTIESIFKRELRRLG